MGAITGGVIGGVAAKTGAAWNKPVVKGVDEFSKLLNPNKVLSQEELKIVKAVRSDIGLPSAGTKMNKTIPQSDIYKYLNGEYSGVRGFVSVDEHSSALKGLDSVYEGNRLDYNNTLFKIGYGVDGVSKYGGAPDTVYGKITYILDDEGSGYCQ